MAGAGTAVLHDYLVQLGGAERVAGRIAAMHPEAALFTSAHDAESVPPSAAGGRPWRTSFLQAAVARTGARPLFPLLPHAFASLDLHDFDMLISSTSGFAHHARKAPGAVHVAYCHTPPRFLWRTAEYFRGSPRLRAALRPLLALLRARDRAAAARVDRYVAVSSHIAGRIAAVYGRETEVVHPPVDVARFLPSPERSERFLVVSRLVAAKRVDLVIGAANRYGLPLDVIGAGPEERRLRRLAGPSVRFHGWQPDEVVAAAMARAVATVVAGEEDFGLVTAETQAAGRAPVAFVHSGAADIVEDGVTGYLFGKPTVEALAEAMLRAREGRIPACDLRESARRFDVATFEAGLTRAVEEAVAAGTTPQAAPAATMALSGTRA